MVVKGRQWETQNIDAEEGRGRDWRWVLTLGVDWWGLLALVGSVVSRRGVVDAGCWRLACLVVGWSTQSTSILSMVVRLLCKKMLVFQHVFCAKR